MHANEMAQIQCPRCTAPVAIGADGCSRCGLSFEPTRDGAFIQATGPVCPRCDRHAEPGTRFVGMTGRSEHGTCGHCGTGLVLPDRLKGSAYEEKSEPCAAFEIEQLARSESVDGWRLLDTTVDPAAPDRIVAHFRRYVRAEDFVKQGRRERVEARPKSRASRRTRPASRPAPARPSRRARAAAPQAPSPQAVARAKSDPALRAARRAVEAADAEARRAAGAQPRDPRSRARAIHQQARDARRQAKDEARQARARARRQRHAARMRHRGPVSRHAQGAMQGGSTALAGLIAFAVHLALFAVVFALRYVAIPMAMLALRLAQAVVIAVFDELSYSLTRRRYARVRYHRRRRIHWA